MWFVGAERAVMFDRRYRPLWQRWADGRSAPADPDERVPFTTQVWFYKDGVAATYAYLEQTKSDFLAGTPLKFVTVPRHTHAQGALVTLKADGPKAEKSFAWPVARRDKQKIILH
jgi:hypothetical protein